MQLTKEYYAEYRAVTEPMFVKERKITVYKRMGKALVAQKDTNLE